MLQISVFLLHESWELLFVCIMFFFIEDSCLGVTLIGNLMNERKRLISIEPSGDLQSRPEVSPHKNHLPQHLLTDITSFLHSANSQIYTESHEDSLVHFPQLSHIAVSSP